MSSSNKYSPEVRERAVRMVLEHGYGCVAGEIAAAIEAIARMDTVVTDSLAVESGLAALRAGGDIADGSIAGRGERPGGPLFSSLDRRAVSVLRSRGADAAEPSELVA